MTSPFYPDVPQVAGVPSLYRVPLSGQLNSLANQKIGASQSAVYGVISNVAFISTPPFNPVINDDLWNEMHTPFILDSLTQGILV